METVAEPRAFPNALLTLGDAANLTQVSKRKLQLDMANGALAYVKLGRSVRFLPADLHAYILARRISCRHDRV